MSWRLSFGILFLQAFRQVVAWVTKFRLFTPLALARKVERLGFGFKLRRVKITSFTNFGRIFMADSIGISNIIYIQNCHPIDFMICRQRSDKFAWPIR